MPLENEGDQSANVPCENIDFLDTSILNKPVICKVTGFTGVATGIVKYSTGRVNVLVEPQKGEYRWIEVERLEII